MGATAATAENAGAWRCPPTAHVCRGRTWPHPTLVPPLLTPPQPPPPTSPIHPPAHAHTLCARTQLTPAEYDVLRNWGTEFSGSSPLDKLYKPGTYVCKACNTPLWRSEDKFDSGTGWPSFSDHLPGAIDKTVQLLYLIGDFGCREVRCHHCASHQGTFSDGPPPTGKRYRQRRRHRLRPEGEPLPKRALRTTSTCALQLSLPRVSGESPRSLVQKVESTTVLCVTSGVQGATRGFAARSPHRIRR